MKSLLPLSLFALLSCTAATNTDAGTSDVVESRLEVSAVSLGTLSVAAHGIAVSSDGSRLYISDSFSQQRRGIYVCPFEEFVESDCEFFTNPNFGTPSGITVFNGEIYISDVQSGRVFVFDESRLNETGLNEPVRAIEVAQVWNSERIGEAFLSVTNDGRVVAWSSPQTQAPLLSGLFDPFDIARGNEGYWVSEQSSVAGTPGSLVFLNAEDEIVFRVGDGLQNPEGLADDGRGGVWVAETELNELRLYDAEGKLVFSDEGFNIPVALQSAKSENEASTDDLVLFDVGSGQVFRILVDRN